MYASYSIIEHKKHLLLENHQGLILIDTGSPFSFHKDEVIELGDYRIEVPNSIYGIVDSNYLSDILGIANKRMDG